MSGTDIKDFLRRGRVRALRCRMQTIPRLNLADGETVIVAPHPDDEVLGCGGLIGRLTAQGRMPHVVVMTGGGGSHRGCCSTPEPVIIENRRRLTLKALGGLGVEADHIHFLDFTDGSIGEADEERMAQIGKLIDEIRPEAVFVPHSGEGWSDHIAARRIAMLLAPADAEVWEYCVWMWYYNVWKLDWRNAYRLKMSREEHTKKLQAVDDYVLPAAPCGKPWSGVLPASFVKANTCNTELYFKAR